MPSQTELVSSIKVILKTADLDTISAKQVRKQLENDYNCDLTVHKRFIDKTIMELIDEMDSVPSHKSDNEKNTNTTTDSIPSHKSDNEQETNTTKKKMNKRSPSPMISSEDSEVSDIESDTNNKKKKKIKREPSSIKSGTAKKNLVNGGTKKDANANDVASFAQTSNRACRKNNRGSKADVRVSPELAKIIGAEVLPMSEISLRLHQEALSRQLHEGSDKMYIVCDADFKALLGQDRIRASTLTNHCKKHIFKIKKEKSEDKRKSGNSTYSKKYWLSPQLADILGYNHLPRHAVVKLMWALIKSRGLQDPKNKQFMLADEQLIPIFKNKRIRTFGMMKHLTAHMAPDEDYFEYSSTFPEYVPAPDDQTNGTTEGS